MNEFPHIQRFKKRKMRFKAIRMAPLHKEEYRKNTAGILREGEIVHALDIQIR